MGKRTFILTVFAILFGTLPATAVVIGKDDRLLKVPENFAKAESSLGTISIYGAQGCTAFCVAPNVIATSAHCVLDKSGNWRQKSTFYMFNQFSNGKRTAHFMPGRDAEENRMNVVLGTRIQGVRHRRWLQTRAKDWALVKIDRSPCKTVLPLAPHKNLPKATKRSKIGMPSLLYLDGPSAQGRRISPLFSTNCKFTKWVPGLPSRYQRGFRKRVGAQVPGMHTCDAQKGQSGSPIVQRLPDGRLQAVAIHSGHATWCVTRKKKRRCYPFSLSAPVTTLARSLERLKSETLVGKPGIEAIQRALSKRKLYKGRIDGVFGAGTRRAIHNYERTARLARLGLPTVQLMKKLRLKIPTKQTEPAPSSKLEASRAPVYKLVSADQGTIIGKDERTPLVPKAFAEATPTVGMLSYRQGFCNAFCLADNIVATNASCITNTAGQWKNWRNNFQFVRWSGGRELSGKVVGHAFSTREENIVLGRRQRPPFTDRLNLNALDWALLRIEQGVCEKVLSLRTIKKKAAVNRDHRLGMLSLLSWSVEDRYRSRMSAVYSSDCKFVKNIPNLASSHQKGLYQKVQNSGILLHTCDSQAEQAGSPVVQVFPNGEIAAVAINAGKVTLRDQSRKQRKRDVSVNIGIAPGILARSLERFKTETVVNLDDIKRIQAELRRRRLHTGRVDGIFDLNTRGAILKFEEKLKLAPLGLPTKQFMRHLKLR